MTMQSKVYIVLFEKSWPLIENAPCASCINLTDDKQSGSNEW